MECASRKGVTGWRGATPWEISAKSGILSSLRDFMIFLGRYPRLKPWAIAYHPYRDYEVSDIFQ